MIIVRLWDHEDGNCLVTWNLQAPVHSISVSACMPDHALVSLDTGKSPKVRQWSHMGDGSLSGRIWGEGSLDRVRRMCVCVCSHMGDGSRCRMGEGSLSGSYEEGDTTRICDNFVSQPTHLVQEHTTLFVTFWRAQPTHLIQPMNTRKKKTGAPAPPKTGKWSVTPIIMIIVDLVLN